MTENKINAICLAGGTSMNYFSGVRWGNSERLFGMVLPARGEPFFICPAFEEGRAQEQIASGGAAHGKVFTWQEDESPYTLLALALKESGLLTGQLAVEEAMPFVLLPMRIAHAAPAATVVSATPVTAGCRMIKSPAEMALLRLASSVTLQAYEAAWKSLREGMTNREFSGVIGTAYQALGFPGYASVQVGEYSALPHGSGQPQIIREGSIVLIDDGCTVEGYESDILSHLRDGDGHRQDEASFRNRPQGAECGAGRRSARGGLRGGGRGGAQGDCRCRLWSRLPLLHPPRRPWARNGRARVALPGAR